MERKSSQLKGVWIAVSVAAGAAAAAGVYLVLRSLKTPPASDKVRRVQAVIKEAEDLIKHHQ